jgi:hypothetical protein
MVSPTGTPEQRKALAGELAGIGVAGDVLHVGGSGLFVGRFGESPAREVGERLLRPVVFNDESPHRAVEYDGGQAAPGYDDAPSGDLGCGLLRQTGRSRVRGGGNFFHGGTSVFSPG